MRSLDKLEEEAKADLVAGRIIKCLWANDLEWIEDDKQDGQDLIPA
jgi:hypothetical protein